MTLQLLSLLDVSSIERIGVGMSIAWRKTSQPIGSLGRKPRSQMRTS